MKKHRCIGMNRRKRKRCTFKTKKTNRLCGFHQIHRKSSIPASQLVDNAVNILHLLELPLKEVLFNATLPEMQMITKFHGYFVR